MIGLINFKEESHYEGGLKEDRNKKEHMKISIIAKLLNNEIDVFKFKEIINNEILEYSNLLKKKGSSISIFLIEDDNILIKSRDFNFLCNLFLEDKLDNYEILYIMDALSLSSNIQFENEKIRESVEEFGFTENGNLSKDSVRKYMEWI
jgi:hypothetical protein